MLRAIVLSLALLIGMGTIIPLATEYTEAGPKKQRKYKQNKKRTWRGVKKYSKKWWQLYRAQERRKKAVRARKRTLRLRQIRLAEKRNSEVQNDNVAQATAKNTPQTSASDNSKTALLPTGETAPKGWKSGQSTQGELQFRVDNESGSPIGSASISVVGPSMSEDSGGGRNKTVGGVSTTSLRRTVIDRMVREEGWVVNDYQKDIGGKKVYVVVAQSPGTGGTLQARMFYFTEVDGRIYSVSTNAPNDASKRLEEESEKVINSLQRRKGTVQQASNR